MQRITYEEAMRATYEEGYNDHLYAREAEQAEIERMQMEIEQQHKTGIYWGSRFMALYDDGAQLGVYARSFGEAWHIADRVRPGHATKGILIIN